MPLTKWMKDMQDGDQPVELPKYVGAGDPRMRRMANAMEHDRQLRFRDDCEFDEFTAWMNSGRR